MTETSTTTGVRLLRDLDDDEFVARYDCDRFTAAAVASRLRHVVATMSNRFRDHAFSPIVRDGSDLCGMLSGPPGLGYPMVAVSETVPLFYGSIPDGVRTVLEEYGTEKLVPGDVLFVNDYYRMGCHLNDGCCIRPVFARGQIVAVLTLRAHLTDIGGTFPGGFDLTKRTIYEDGLRVPPMLICSAGEPVNPVLNLIDENSRFGHLVIPDLMTELHALEFGEGLLRETLDRYSIAAFLGTVRFVCDLSAESMAAALRALPDGVYHGEEWLDGDGLPDSPAYGIRVRIHKVGDRAELDLRGNPGPTRTAMNAAWPDIKTAVAMAFMLLLDPGGAMTSGTLRNVDVVVPPEAIFNAGRPHPCQFYYEVVMTLVYAVFRALNPALGEDAVAAPCLTAMSRVVGRLPDGSAWQPAFLGPTMSGSWGATRHGDGDSSQVPVYANFMQTGVEAWELEMPGVIVQSEYVPDTAGPGANRGGASTMHDVMWTYPAEVRTGLAHSRHQPAGGGVRGGGAGPTTAIWVFDGSFTGHGSTVHRFPLAVHDEAYRHAVPRAGVVDPVTHEYDSAGEYVSGADGHATSAGSTVRTLTSGAGGWGDPFTRDPQRVLRDVQDEYVTIAGAARDYGVVVVGDLDRPGHLAVDIAATDRLRAEGRSA